MFVKAIDLASHVTMVTVGPVIIDATPPVINGSISGSLINSGRVYLVTWDDDGFYDNEDLTSLEDYEYSLGKRVHVHVINVSACNMHIQCT